MLMLILPCDTFTMYFKDFETHTRLMLGLELAGVGAPVLFSLCAGVSCVRGSLAKKERRKPDDAIFRTEDGRPFFRQQCEARQLRTVSVVEFSTTPNPNTNSHRRIQ